MVLLIIVLVLVFGLGGGYYGYGRWGHGRRRWYWAWHSPGDRADLLSIGSYLIERFAAPSAVKSSQGRW